MFSKKKSDSAHPGYQGNQPLFLGVWVVLFAALINLLPWVFAVRGTPAGQAQALKAGKLKVIKKNEARIVDLKAGKILGRQGSGRNGSGYKRVPVTGARRDFMIKELRRAIKRVELELESSGFALEIEDRRMEVCQRYELLDWINKPAIFIMGFLGRPQGFTDEKVINSFGARLGTTFMVMFGWMPIALLLGLILVFLGWHQEAHGDLAACEGESSLAIRGFLGAEAVWLLLFLLVSFYENIQESTGRGVVSQWLMSALWLTKLLQVYLIMRGCFALRVRTGSLLLMGTLAGIVFLHWLALLLIYEEFSSRRELLAARISAAKDKVERAKALELRAKETDKKKGGQ